MALAECPECKGQISDAALRCPHCGFPRKGACGSHDRLMRFLPVLLFFAVLCALALILCSPTVNVNSHNGFINFNSKRRGIFHRLNFSCRCFRR
jgi:hypothetical protein